MFVDETRVFFASGRGGNGAVTFRREKYRPKGGPDGGNGGKGGSIVLVADESVSSLADLKDHPHQRARPGGPGKSNNRSGADAPDLEIGVPTGTIVRDESGVLLADLAEQGQRFLVAAGGRGGRGNAAFLSEKRRAPGFGELGEPGEELWLVLELRLIADVAVVGFPNAGKSSLVSALSAARPKIAAYPFTTLDPSLGVVIHDNERFTICDVPGLIEGAAEGKGLGLKFLRHATRALILVHLIDAGAGRDPLDDYRVVRGEIDKYAEDLASRTEVLVLNKIDIVDASELQSIRAAFQAEGLHPLEVSATERTGLDALVDRLIAQLALARSEAEASRGFELFRSDEEGRPTVKREGKVWQVSGKNVERMVAMTDMSNPEAVAYLQGRLERAGVERMLSEAGAHGGDEVRIGGIVFEWWPAGEAPSTDQRERSR